MANESFRWAYYWFDISGILDGISEGMLQPTRITLSHEFIKRYCELFLDPTVTPRPPIQVSPAHAETLPSTRLLSPILLIHVGTNEGLVSLFENGAAPDYVVGDGNHRLLAALQRGETLEAFVLSQSDSASYRTEFEE